MPPGLPGPSPCLLFPVPPLVRCDPWFSGARVSPSDLSSLSLANPGRPRASVCVGSVLTKGTPGGALQVCPPVCRRSRPSLHGHAPAHFLSPCLLPASQPASPAAALFRDANIHTLLEPQIKGGVPRPASQWSLCADGSLRGVRTRQRGGAGKGLSTDTCPPEEPAKTGEERPQVEDVPRSPLEGANEGSQLRGEENTALCVVSVEGTSGWLHEQQPRTALGRCIWAKAAWGNRVAVTSPWDRGRGNK